MKNGKTFALFLIAAAFLLLLTACGGAGQTAAETPAPSGGTLMQDSESINGSPVFGSPTLTRGQIRSITFLSDTSDAPADSWDVSQEQNGSVIAWAVENGELYDLFIASDGGVIAPENCNSQFRGYIRMESIAFNSAFDTSHVTDMSCMFIDCESLTELDLSGFDTSNVMNMSGMFLNCNVKTLDLSGFDTSHVTAMDYMFQDCNRLTALDISALDTSSVQTVEGMFYKCYAVTEEDVSKLDLSKARDVDLIFTMIHSPSGKHYTDGREYHPAVSETSVE